MTTQVEDMKTSVTKKIKTWAAGRFLSRVHRITHRIPVELRGVQSARVMVLAPHMDDEVIGPGGTLALHQQAGRSGIEIDAGQRRIVCVEHAAPDRIDRIIRV